MSLLPRSVLIREVGPREGFQTLKNIFATEKKLQLIHLLAATGVSEMEVTSMVRPDRLPQMADAEEIIKGLPAASAVNFTALYLNQKGFERAEKIGGIHNKGWLYTATSETFLKKNANTSHQEILASIPAWLKLFHSYGKSLHGVMISTSFGCGYEGKAAAARLGEVVSSLMQALKTQGVVPKELSLADTVGFGNPPLVKRAVGDLKSRYPEVEISLHLHDTYGTGVANAYAGLEEGVAILEGSVGGMGGCPFTPGAAGNVATEELVYLCAELGISTNIDLTKYCDAARYAEEMIGERLPGRLHRRGNLSI